MTQGGTGGTSSTESALTQEVRFAVVMTGGASLAVWMGGVAREINLLTIASGARRDPDRASRLSPADAAVAAGYAKLLDILDVDVAVDVLAGASAGGINAALLGYANAHDTSLSPLRDLWISLGSFSEMLRRPTERTFPSLLRGDAVVLPAIHRALRSLESPDLADPADGTRTVRPTSVFITTTILRGERSAWSDSLGGTVCDTDHRGLFVFGEDDLTDPGAAARLALAARASAAFPGAFEPVYVPVGHSPDAAHPDMAEYVNAARSFHGADGGILVNRPIGPALQTIFDRPAQGHQVRRLLAYVVPSPGAPVPEATQQAAASADAELPAPPSVAATLMSSLGAALNQSIASELRRLREHNDAVRAARANRRRLLRAIPPNSRRLADDVAYGAYRRRTAEQAADAVLGELGRIVADAPAAAVPPDAPTLLASADGRSRLRMAAIAAALAELPEHLPGPANLADLWRLGRPAVDAVKGILLSMINEAYLLTADPDERAALGTFARSVHGALVAPRDPASHQQLPLPSTPANRGVFTTVARTLVDRTREPATIAVAEAVRRWLRGHADPESARTDLTLAWSTLGLLAESLRRQLADLVDRASAASPELAAALAAGEPRPHSRPNGLTLAERRAAAARTLSDFVNYLPPRREDAAIALLDLHLMSHALTGRGLVDQTVELVQVSADIRCDLDPSRDTAARKLTGLQLGNFGAFAKASWRASDWMWGRLDGAGWLVRILLDPRRLVWLRDLAGDPMQWRDQLIARLTEIAGTPAPAAALAELAVLADPDAPVAASLPETAAWVAAGIQREIAAVELVSVADAVRQDISEAGADPRPTRDFLDRLDRALRSAADARDAGAAKPTGDDKDGDKADNDKADNDKAGNDKAGNDKADEDEDKGRAEAGGRTKKKDRTRNDEAAGKTAGRAADQAVRMIRPAEADEVLQACQISAERLTHRQNGPVTVTLLAHTVAVVTGWLASLRMLPRSFRPAAFAARTVARLAFELVHDVTRGRRWVTIGTGTALIALGLTGAVMLAGPLGGVAILVALAGLFMITLTSWRRLPGGLAIVGCGVLGVIAAAGVIPFVGDRLFPWLQDDAIPYLAEHAWAWAVVFGLLVLPPVWSVAEAVLTRRSRRRAHD